MSETAETVAPKATDDSEQKGILRDLQAERSKRQDAEKRLADMEAANKEVEQKRLEENEEYKTLYQTEKELREKYEPLVKAQEAKAATRKADLLEKLGDDLKRFEHWDVDQLEILMEERTKLSSNPPSDPGNPGMTPAGEFGGFKSKSDLAHAVARGVPGAREAYNRIRGGA